jgi:2-phosphoglycolate phosphatase
MPSTPPTPRLRTVLFDLDGTLADTAPDISFALNTLLDERGRPPLPYAVIRPVVSHGSNALITCAFGLQTGDNGFDELKQRFLAIYESHLAVDTRLFPGMAELLNALTGQGRNWGVVTNKPGWLTRPLMERLGVAEKAVCIVSGDSTAHRKPHPAPMLLACREAGSEPAQCLYVGDARRDIEAGKNAGMHTLVALFGYLGAADTPLQWGADAMIDTPAAVLDWIARTESGAQAAPSVHG